MKITILLSLLSLSFSVFSQDTLKEEVSYVYESFAGTRVINNHSNECLPKNSLEFIVAHKFGDMLGSGGGIQNFFGFDNLADVRIAFEYGILDPLDVGIGRNKGVATRTEVIDGYVKYQILRQKTSGMPVSLVYVSSMALPYGRKILDSSSVKSYPRFINRFMFTNQILVTRKFHPRFTWQLNAGYHHRNFVTNNDVNGLFFAGTSARVRVTKMFGFLVEYNHVFNRPSALNAKNPLSFGVEILTGGHIFALHFSNGKGINENLFLSQTYSDWLEGQWRFGFSINRRFKL
ncbi:MAG: hypothetical protein HUJ25_16735 [Crocinitomicaceae bacterium]|nr:hypothetical protein [Crocinitomicaceae bacterium]